MHLVLRHPRLAEEHNVLHVVGDVEMHPATKEVCQQNFLGVADVKDCFIYWIMIKAHHVRLTLHPAFRDREAGSVNNRGKPTDEGLRQDRHHDRTEGGRNQANHDGRGGRGGRGGSSRGSRGARDDRHTRGLPKYASLFTLV